MRRVALVVVLFASMLACSSEPDTPDRRTARSADDAAWSEKAAMPTPRTEVAAASLGKRVFVAGGFARDGSVSPAVEIYDAGRDRWTEGRPLPEPRHHAALAALRGRLYLIGGYLADGAATKAVHSARVSATGEVAAWRREPDMPTARGALAVAVVAGRIHAVGGASAFRGVPKLVGAHESFDVAARRWRKRADLPDPRDHLAAAGGRGEVYVAGGRKLSTTSNSSRFDIYDPTTDRWERGPDMPTARGGIAAAAVAGVFVVFGGEDPQRTYATAEVYERKADRWTAAPAMPTSRHGLGAAVVGDRVYVVGGGTEPGLSVSGATEILDVNG